MCDAKILNKYYYYLCFNRDITSIIIKLSIKNDLIQIAVNHRILIFIHCNGLHKERIENTALD